MSSRVRFATTKNVSSALSTPLRHWVDEGLGRGLVSWNPLSPEVFSDLPDALVVSQDEPQARLSTLAAAAAGVPVLWIGQGAPKVLGAPVVTRPVLDAVSLDSVLTAGNRSGAAGDGGPDVSVIITTLNEGPALAQLLRVLAGQMRSTDECVVIDGGSTDDCVDLAREAVHGDPRFVIEVSPGAGISEGRNIGIRRAVHDHLLCTDAGCHPEADWVDSMRRAFTAESHPGLVSGCYQVTSRGPLEQAQALACYPDEYEARHRDLLTAVYTTVFGTAFDPRFCVGRCVAFTRQAWESVGGFPEHLPTGEDVTFGLAVAKNFSVVGTADARLGWDQRDTLGATFRMYRNYGRSSADGGNVRLLVRDAARGTAYLALPALAASSTGRKLAVLGAICYLSVPVRRAVRHDASPATVACIPVAMATKDLGKMWGALQGLVRAAGRK